MTNASATKRRRRQFGGLAGRWLTIGSLAVMGLHPGAVRAQTSLAINRLIHIAATGTPQENCQALKDTLASIGDASEPEPPSDASEENRYVLKLEPGIYDCGENFVPMTPWVSIEGSGTATEIRSTSRGFATVELASNTELRSVKVVNNGNEYAYAVGVYLRKVVTSTRLYDVTAMAPGAGGAGFLGFPVDSGGELSLVRVEIDHSHISGAAHSLKLFSAGTQEITCNFSILDGEVTNDGQTTMCRFCTTPENERLDLDCNVVP